MRTRIVWKGKREIPQPVDSVTVTTIRKYIVDWSCELLAKTCLLKNVAVSFSLLSRSVSMPATSEVS